MPLLPFLRDSLIPRASALSVMALLGLGAVSTAGEGAGSLSSIAEREIARRQAKIAGANDRLKEGISLQADGKPGEAASLLLETYRDIPDAPLTQDLRAAVRDAYCSAACAHARDLLKEARYREAHQMLDTVLAADMEPQHKEARLLKKQAADPDRYPPALTPDHLANEKQVTDLLTKAGSFLNIGDYDQATATYAAVLRIDTYNTAARRGMEKVEQEKAKYLGAAYDHARTKLLNDANKQWETTVPPSSDMTDLFVSSRASSSAVQKGRREKLEKKLREIKIPKLEFSGASLDEVIEYLRITTASLDPEGKGVDFIINAPDETKSRTMNLSLQDMPLEEVVRYVVQMAQAAYRVEESAVVITSLTEKSTAMISKSYRVPPDFLQTGDAGNAAAPAPADPFAPATPTAAAGVPIRRMGAKQFLEARGVTFGPDASASFSPATSTLVVRNTADNIALVDMLVEQSANNAPKQVVIQVKILDVEERLFAEVSNQILLGQGNVPGTERAFFTGGTPEGTFANTTAGLRGSGNILGAAKIDELLALSKGQEVPSLDSRSPAAIQLFGALTDPQFAMLTSLLNQKTGRDLLSAPSVISRSGQKAEVRIGREFPYPTEFDPPEIPQQVGTNVASTFTNINGVSVSQGANGAPITPTTPTTFEFKQLGTVLEVEPVISEDGRTVDLVIAPSNTEFEGFVDYGSDITNSTASGSLDLLTFTLTNRFSYYNIDNPILQPVFRKSAVSTSVTVWDGQTVVLGGALRETVTDNQDKVPVIGDIPLVGRLWQSKVKQSIKKAVLIFVTVKVIDPGGMRINPPVDAATEQAALR
jgi:general secretion pathway protein D